MHYVYIMQVAYVDCRVTGGLSCDVGDPLVLKGELKQSSNIAAQKGSIGRVHGSRPLHHLKQNTSSPLNNATQKNYTTTGQISHGERLYGLWQ